jgi:hypothetical protein
MSNIKPTYIIYWEEDDNKGWYYQVSGFEPVGPFDSQIDAFEAIMMDYNEYNFITSDKDSCSKKDCNLCEIKCTK